MRDDEFAWDDDKAAINLAAHKVSFDEARLVFRDPLPLDLGEDRRGYGEQRYNIIGRSGDKLLFVTYSDDSENLELTRIISARLAEPNERKAWRRNLPLGPV